MSSGDAKETDGGPAVYCRICGKYTLRNCKGLKDKCPGTTGTSKAWLMRMGKDKKHPANARAVITREWDVSSLKAGWESEHRTLMAAGCLGRIMATMEPCKIDAVEGSEGKRKGEVQVTVSKVEARTVQDKDVESDSEWEAASGYDSEGGYFFGAFPNRGVG
jgi:hypothetical protein